MTVPEIWRTGAIALSVTFTAMGCSRPAIVDAPLAYATPAAMQGFAGNEEASGSSVGERLIQEGRYEQAVDELTRALAAAGFEEQPLSILTEGAKLYYRRGVAYLKMGFPDTAAADLTDAIKLVPNYGDAYEARGRAYLALGDAFKARRDLTQAIRLQADNAGAYRARGEAYLERGDYERAVADFEHAVQQDPVLEPATRALLSQAYLRWSQELAEEGDTVLAAEKLAAAKQFNGAHVEQQQAAEVEPPPTPLEQTVAKPVINEADELFAAGLEQQQAGKLDQALANYTRAIDLRPDFAEAYLRRGHALLALGFPDTAIEDLKAATWRESSPELLAEALRLQAVAYLRLKSPYRAALAATEALHADPTSGDAYALRGRAYFALENWQRSINDLEEAIRRDPELDGKLEPMLAEARRFLRQSQQPPTESRAAGDERPATESSAIDARD